MEAVNAALEAELSPGGSPSPVVASVHTPYQLMFLERLLEQVGPRPILLLDQRPEAYRLGRPPRIARAEILDLPLTGSFSNADERALIAQAITCVENFITDRPFVYLCASLGWPINNVVYTRMRRREQGHFALIEDGLSTYLQARQSLKWRMRNLALKIIGYLRGYPARTLFGGHPLGLDQRDINVIFVGSSLVAREGGRRYVCVPPLRDRTAKRRDPSLALFVGQPYLRDYGREAIETFIDKSLSYLASQGVERLQFKPHHFQTREEVSLYLRKGMEIKDPPITVEELIEISEYGVIASCNTTALMTVKSMFGGDLRAIAINPTAFKQVQESRDPAEVMAIFRRFDVEVVDL